MLLLDERHRLVGVGLRKDIEIVGPQVVRPRLEDLDNLRAAVDLVRRVRCDVFRDMVQERVQNGGLVVHHLLGVEAVLVGLPLDGVCSKGERRADEAEQRGLALRLLAERLQRLAQKRHGLVGVIDRRHLLDLCCGAYRVIAYQACGRGIGAHA